MEKILTLLAWLMTAGLFASAQSVGESNTARFSYLPYCFEAAPSVAGDAANSQTYDVCIKRSAAGVLTFTQGDLSTVASIKNLKFSAGVAGAASFNLPTGVVPTTSAVGDWWVPVQVVPSFSEVSGSAISVVGNIYSLAGAQAATVVNTATTITGSSFTLPAGVMNVAGKTLEGEGWLTSINTTGTPTVAIAVKIGSITLATCTSAAITNAVTAPVHFTFTVKTAAIGASGTDESHCALDIPLAAAGNAVGRYLDANVAVSSTYDHTAANAIVLVGTSAGASNSLTLRDLRYDIKN